MTTRLDTGAAKLPGIPKISVADAALQQWIRAVTEWIEVRTGSRGNTAERAVTQRELDALAGQLNFKTGIPTPAPGETVIPIGNGLYATLSIEAFANSIRNTQLYRDLMRSIDDPARFDGLAVPLRELIATSIASEAAARGTAVTRVEISSSTANEAIAAIVEEVTAALGLTTTGIRDTMAAFASETASQGIAVTQIESSLGNYYQDGSPGRASLEETLSTQASLTEGLSAQYTLKVSAGGALAGFGIAATEVDGTPSSAFIISAEKFAIVSPTYTGGLTNSPDVANVPFGIDSGGIYLNGQVRINAQTKSVKLTASTYVYNASTGSPTSITITANLLGGLTGTATFFIVGGTLSGTGNTRTLSTSSIATTGATITATITDAFGTYTDLISIGYVANGSAGATGATGTRGSIQLYISGSSWSDTAANDAITSATGSSTRVIGDTVTISNTTNFAATKYWSGTSWVDPGVIIDGNLLVTGTLSASKINGGTFSGASISIAASSLGTLLSAGNNGTVVGYRELNGYNITAGNLASPSAPAITGTTNFSGVGVSGVSVASNSSSSAHGVRGSNQFQGTSGLVGAANGYNFYADGTPTGTFDYGTFTGAHDALVAKGSVGALEPGDIVIDTHVVAKGNISNQITEVVRSSAPNQKGALGVFVALSPIPIDRVPTEDDPNPFLPNALRSLSEAELAAVRAAYTYVVINALGEGLISVCGENGDIAVGDLIVTSSTPGKGMKQADDIVRSCTVAKAREAVTFASPTEVKQIACIYLCG
jgi:hypothetical protein